MADAIDCIDAGNPEQAKTLLIAAQQYAEQKYVEHPDGVAIAFPRKKKKPKVPKER